MKNSVLFKASFFLLALQFFSAVVFADSATDIPKLNLQVRKIAQYPNLSGWRFDVRNNDSKPINISDLEIRFWVFEPNKKLIGKFYRANGWVDAYGIVNGEAVMCAFLSPSYETIGSRKADYAIRYRTSKDYWIQPGETWKNVRFGYGSADINETTSYSQMPMKQKGGASEGFFFSSTYDDPHFCLYYRGELVQEWLSSKKIDPDTGVEPEPYRTTGKPAAILHDPQPAQPSDSINPMYSNLPELVEPLKIGDQSKVIMQNGQMINVAQAKMEVQAYMQNHPGQTIFARAMTGNPNIHYASMPSQPTNGVAFNYDADGNVVTDPSGRTFTYDSLDRMISATGPSLAVSYVYDGDGLRVKKINNITGIETDYLWDTNNITGFPQVLEEHQNGQVVCVYTYGTDGLISMDQLINGSWALHYFGKDGQGSVRELQDQNGNVTDTFDYDAFGNLLNQTGSTQNNMLYAREYFDSDVQLYYLRNRWMSPSIGRFYSMDSYEGQQEDPLSLHKYVYAANNPANKIDPTGNDYSDIAGASNVAAIDLWPVSTHPLGEGIFVESAHVVGEFQHLFLKIVPYDQGVWAKNTGFKNKDRNGNSYETFGAGPGIGNFSFKFVTGFLISGENRPSDVASATNPLISLQVGPKDSPAQDTEINAIENSFIGYLGRNNLIYDASGRIGHNSNSYISGLLSASGIPKPNNYITNSAYPGWDHPVPPLDFQ